VRCPKGHRTVFYFVGTGGRFWLEGWVFGQCRDRAVAAGVNAGVLGSCVSGLSHRRVAALNVSDLLRVTNFFITVSHCAWQHVISWSLATKKRSKENAFNHATLSVHSVQFPFIGAPKARCSPERRMCETLLLRTQVLTRFATSD
jgi:hypothetical protein